MKTMKLFFMAALALLMTACSNDDNEIVTPEQPAKAEGITITAQLAPKDGGTTRAVSDQSTYIKAEWAVDEHIAILYEVSSTKKVADARITAVDGSGVATITFIVDGSTANNTACTLVYPLSAAKDDNSGVKDYATLFATQNGALSASLDIRVGVGTIQAATPSLTVTTQPAAQYSIFKMTLKDIAGSVDKSASEFIVRNSSNDIITTVTPTSATNKLYIALPNLTTGTYWFSATVSGQPYIAKATVSTATIAGKYYQSTVKMATLGDLMGGDGKFYANKDAATAASTTAVAMIAYVGNDTGNATYKNGLAISLANDCEQGYWQNAKDACEGKTPVPNALWVFPTEANWRTMMFSNGGNNSNYTGLNSKISTAGGVTLCTESTEHRYWAEKVGVSSAKRINLKNDGSIVIGYGDPNNDIYGDGRACLVF